jgi:3-dehydroquinate synthase
MPACTETTSPAFVVRDAFPLPMGGDPIHARAVRCDEYDIHVTRTADQALDRLVELLDGAKVAVVSDEHVMDELGPALLDGLHARDIDVIASVLPAGERSKSLQQATRLWHWLAESPIARRDVLVSFGGGVICDTAGWVASAFMRGIPYLNVPTTLLAQVDGALGGKVAVNHPLAKNLLGAFFQPLGVISNVSYVATTSDRHIRAGLAECIKKAVIASPDYADLIESDLDAILARDGDALEQLVRGASAIKAALIERDPYEDDLRRPLNFGHTIGHPLETVSGYGPLLHGEAVAFGMVVESRIAANRGLMDPGTLVRIVGLLRRAQLPTTAAELPPQITPDAVIAAMEKVRQIRAGSLRYVLPIRFGESVIADDVTEAEARQALHESGYAAS